MWRARVVVSFASHLYGDGDDDSHQRIFYAIVDRTHNLFNYSKRIISRLLLLFSCMQHGWVFDLCASMFWVRCEWFGMVAVILLMYVLNQSTQKSTNWNDLLVIKTEKKVIHNARTSQKCCTLAEIWIFVRYSVNVGWMQHKWLILRTNYANDMIAVVNQPRCSKERKKEKENWKKRGISKCAEHSLTAYLLVFMLFLIL